MQRVGVHRQERKPGILGFGNRSSGPMFIDVPDGELLVVTAKRLPKALLAKLLVELNHWTSPKMQGINVNAYG
jgi:hypothetical protein